MEQLGPRLSHPPISDAVGCSLWIESFILYVNILVGFNYKENFFRRGVMGRLDNFLWRDFILFCFPRMHCF